MIWRTLKSEFYRSLDFKGRTARAPYLLFLASSLLVFAALSLLSVKLFGLNKSWNTILVLTMLFYVPVTSVGVRRLHDVGKSGLHILEPLRPSIYFILLYFIAHLLLLAIFMTPIGIITVLLFAAKLKTLFFAIAGLVFLYATIATLTIFSGTMGMLLLPSDPSENQYGPNPHEVQS